MKICIKILTNKYPRTLATHGRQNEQGGGNYPDTTGEEQNQHVEPNSGNHTRRTPRCLCGHILATEHVHDRCEAFLATTWVEHPQSTYVHRLIRRELG